MKEKFVAWTGMALRRIHAEVDRIANEAFAAGRSMIVKVEVEDGPTAAMRNKFHAMCDDVARSLPSWKGADMSKLHWKAVFIAAALEQEWVPGIDGKPVPYRKSSEDLRRKEYCDCITVAQAFGDQHGVAWSDSVREVA